MARIDQVQITRLAGIAVLLALLVATGFVLRPFIAAGLLAAVFAMSTWPLYRRLRTRLRNDTLAAALMTTITLVLVVLPLGATIEGVAGYVPPLFEQVRAWFKHGLPAPPDWLQRLPLLGDALDTQWQRVAADPGALRDLGLRLIEVAGEPLLSGGRLVGQGLLQLSLATFLSFFMWRDGDALVRRVAVGLRRVSGPLAHEVMDIVYSTVRAVMVGFIGTGFAQGLVAGIGFAIAGVPAPLLLGAITAVVSILPSGTVPMWVGASIWLLVDGQPGWALFMALWGLLLVSTIDNVVRPMIVSRGASLSFLPVFLGMIGGAFAYGFVGLFIGPTLLAVSFRLWQHWSGEVTDNDEATPPRSPPQTVPQRRPGESSSRAGS
jgi:predicted PurR-regulated permease PerM